GEQNFTMGNNGAIIPQSIARRIITEVKQVCPIFAGCTRYSAKGTIKVPVYGDKTADGTGHNITVGYQEEFTELTTKYTAASANREAELQVICHRKEAEGYTHADYNGRRYRIESTGAAGNDRHIKLILAKGG
ncbi:MAG: hypothetical protein K2N29_04870, partial [Ruminiclostridium sp.]|nr:hypothetical protein [Ruminiclostridium sp.]